MNIRQVWEKEVMASELYLANAAGDDELLQVVLHHQLFWAAGGKHSADTSLAEIR